MKKFNFFLLITFICSSLSLQAKDYYFSNLGNDNNDGASEATAFLTLTKAGTLSLLPGDRLLFRRGDSFRGELNIIYSGTAANPISITSYGNGEDAIIRGSEYVNNWVSVGNGIYRASCPIYPQIVFQNGVTQQLGRYPNQGFLFTDAANGNNGFTDNDLPDAGSLYVGAGLHIRTARFRYEERKIASQSGEYLGFDKPTLETIVAGAGYFFTGKLEFVDLGTEYYYDEQNAQLYLKTENGQAPADNTVEATRYDDGFKIGSAANIKIENITFKHQQNSGIHIYGSPSTGLTINNCIFENIYLYGIFGGNKDGLTVTNSQFYDIWSGAMIIGGMTNVLISNNVFKRIGIAAPGRAATDNLISYLCINMNSSSGEISNNIMDSIGYQGILFFQNTLIEKNIIKKYCMSLDDGSGIGAYGTENGIRNGTGSVVRYNVISDAVGSPEGYPPSQEPLTNGIGMDNNSGGAIFEYNTIFNIKGRGISLHNSAFNQIRNNTVFNCNSGALVFEHTYYGGIPNNNIATNNILCNLYENESALKLVNWTESDIGLNFSSFSNNYFINPYFDIPIYTAGWGTTSTGSYQLIQNYYTNRKWKESSDIGLKSSPVKLENYKVTWASGINLVINGNFDTDMNGWECYADYFTCSSNWQSGGPLDGGNVALNSPIYYYGNFHNTILFPVQQSKQYLLNYSIIGGSNSINAIFLENKNGYIRLTDVVKKEVATTRLDQKLLLTSAGNSNETEVIFGIGPEYTTSYSLDNINLQEVTTTPVDPLTQNFLYINTSNSPQTLPLSGSFVDIDGNPVIGTITLEPFTSKILFAAENNTPLPLNILDFGAKLIDNSSTLIEWQLASSDEGCIMEVQKSTDGALFTTIATLNTEKNKPGNEYSFIDKEFTGTSYYRLKTYCVGENPKFSKIALVKKPEGNYKLAVYPNPLTDNKLYVNNTGGFIMAKVFSLEGRILVQSPIKKGTNILTLPEATPKGVYLVELSGNGANQFFKMLKQ